MMLPISRLTVGWMWEEWVVAFFALITESDNLSKRADVGINFIITLVIIFIAFTIHYFLKTWGEYDKADLEDDEIVNNTENTATPNPIQTESMQRSGAP